MTVTPSVVRPGHLLEGEGEEEGRKEGGREMGNKVAVKEEKRCMLLPSPTSPNSSAIETAD